MIEITVCARDNLTLKAPAACMDYLEVLADLTNQEMEAKKEVMAKAFSDMLIYGRSEIVL